MSLASAIRSVAKHRRLTPEERIADLETRIKATEIERDEALIDARESQLKAEEADERAADRDRLASLLEKRNRQVIRQAADLARLRQAVMAARPKITFAAAPRVPPFAPLETLPATAGEPLTVGTWMPFPPDPDGETTVGIALADLLTGRA